MTPATVAEVIRSALLQCFWLALPILLIGFIAGTLISIVQVLISIQDSAFSTVPKLAVFLGTLFVILPWMLTRLMDYTISLFGNLGKYAQY